MYQVSDNIVGYASCRKPYFLLVPLILLVPPQDHRFRESSRNLIFFHQNKQRETKRRIETIIWINRRAEWE